MDVQPTPIPSMAQRSLNHPPNSEKESEINPMNHADRQRLSQLLGALSESGEIEWGRNLQRIAEARAIVDGTTMCGNCGTNHPGSVNCPPIDFVPLRERHPEIFGPPSPKLDAFLTEPIHEYQPIEAYGLRLIAGNHRARRTRLTTAAALALASIALTAATATNTPTGGANGPQPQSKPAEPPSEAAQTWFRPQAAPWIPGHGPGAPGNGLGVVAVP